MMSPELDLLDILLGQDEPLALAMRLFGDLTNSADFAHAQHAVMMQIKGGEVLLIECREGETRILPDWEVRAALVNSDNWQPADPPRYLLCLTAKGVERVG